MPDGKVITSGSNPQRKTEELRIEMFWPPYLFAGARPRCTPAETGIHYSGTVAAAVPDSGQITSVCLIRPGATTHSTDGEQRLIDLPHQPIGQGQISLQLPADPRIAPPGWYMLFAVSPGGVPSQAAGVHLS